MISLIKRVNNKIYSFLFWQTKIGIYLNKYYDVNYFVNILLIKIKSILNKI